MARSSIELTQEIQLRLCEALRVGASLYHAAQYAGISEKTLCRWIKLGKKQEDSTFGQLLQGIEKAKADLVVSLLLKINHAANKHWKAATWKLEHLYPEYYGKPTVGFTDTKKIKNMNTPQSNYNKNHLN